MAEAQAWSQEKLRRALVHVQGTVQGVGYRPFVFKLARATGLRGKVWNSGRGVFTDVEGPHRAVDTFIEAVRSEAPPLARVDEVSVAEQPLKGFRGFTIVASRGGEGTTQVPPDVATCQECREDILDPENRRYRYPFTNCTNCGPRFTIIRETPYDRDKTTMMPFEMCPACRGEYEDPRDRRFHAQPNACPVCGPNLRLMDRRGREVAGRDPIEVSGLLLRGGHILAVKGLGGFHLACDAMNREAVVALRRRKGRPHKPLAVMVPDISWAKRLCVLEREEEDLLLSPSRPILLLRRKAGCPLAEEVAPANRFVGLFLPYTPLHYLLLAEVDRPLIMTSGNRADEPICTGNEEAIERLEGIADFFLLHDRGIHARCDDSVMMVVGGVRVPIRRSRGYVPQTVNLGVSIESEVLGCGADLKNTFCLARGTRAFPGQYVGDLQSYRNAEFWRAGLEHMKSLFSFEPEILAYDLHPDYVSTQQGLSLDVPEKIAVQHHHAHVASCMAEAHLDETIGVAFDGTGYGTDGTVWGGEFLLCNFQDFERLAHLEYTPMPGGEMAIRQPWRMALSHLYRTFGDETLGLGLPFMEVIDGEKAGKVLSMVRRGVRAPLTSSMGRLFDAVASILGIRQEVTYEGQAAIELQMIAHESEAGVYPFLLTDGSPPWRIQTDPIVRSVVADSLDGISTERIAARFQNTVTSIIVHTLSQFAEERDVGAVVLSGGVFQNSTLLLDTVKQLRALGLDVHSHREVPPNDQGISLGQVMVAAAKGGAMKCA